MKLKLNARSWHNLISVVLALPILVVAGTAVFIAHDKALGLKEIEVTRAVAWLPGYGEAAMREMKTEVRASLTAPDGSRWLGTKAGLYRIEAGQARQVEELGGLEVRDLVAAPFGLVLAAKNGVWLKDAAGWSKVQGGDAWSANLLPDGAVAVSVKDRGVLTSRDGSEWQADDGVMSALSAMAAQTQAARPVTLGNLVMDMHTGKAFFGTEWKWVWIDLIGGVMVFLGLTGVYMWWRAEKRAKIREQGDQ